jgi:hypothetical protein
MTSYGHTAGHVTREATAERRSKKLTTIIGHSYGSVVPGSALKGQCYASGRVYHELEVDNAAFLGSPGTRADSTSEFSARGTYFGASRDDLVNREFGNVGRNPTDRAFGAWVVPTADLSGHSEYYTSVSVAWPTCD